MTIQEHVPLAPRTTLGVGGTARYFVEATSIDDVRDAIQFASEKSLPLFVLGGGSNVLIADSGFEGVVLRVCIRDILPEARDARVFVTVGAGVWWDDFVLWSIEHSLAGLECMSGVPGTVGGAVVANLGCYGAQCSDTCDSVEVIDLQNLSVVQIIKKDACHFSYHDSIFSRKPTRYIVVRATFSLATDPAAQPSYRDNRFDLQKLAATLGHTPSQREVRDAVLMMREAKGSLIMDGRFSYKSAGSFFHMPYVSAEKYQEIVAQTQMLDVAKETQLRPWAWKQNDGTYKIAPGFLLEYTEFQKGYERKSVGISPRHTLSIINRGDARATDIAQLADDMQHVVEKKFGIKLEREVEYVGRVESYPHERT